MYKEMPVNRVVDPKRIIKNVVLRSRRGTRGRCPPSTPTKKIVKVYWTGPP
jgi:hypothetical protein